MVIDVPVRIRCLLIWYRSRGLHREGLKEEDALPESRIGSKNTTEVCEEVRESWDLNSFESQAENISSIVFGTRRRLLPCRAKESTRQEIPLGNHRDIL